MGKYPLNIKLCSLKTCSVLLNFSLKFEWSPCIWLQIFLCYSYIYTSLLSALLMQAFTDFTVCPFSLFQNGTFKMVTYFKEEWLSDPLFEKWLVKGADKNSANCKTCQVQFNLLNMGRRAVTSHIEGKKHVQKSKQLSCFFRPLQSTLIKQADLVVDQSGKTVQKSILFCMQFRTISH